MHGKVNPRRRRAGSMALEVLLATAILAIISLTVSNALMAGRQQTSYAQDSMYASFLAQALLEELQRLPYSDPNGYNVLGPDPGQSTRNTFNNQDDYSGWTDGVGTGYPTIVDLAGNAYPTPYQGFTRTVTMTPQAVSPSGWNRTINGLMTTIVVTKNGRVCARLEQLLTP